MSLALFYWGKQQKIDELSLQISSKAKLLVYTYVASQPLPLLD
jgi:hypothetical protein